MSDLRTTSAATFQIQAIGLELNPDVLTATDVLAVAVAPDDFAVQAAQLYGFDLSAVLAQEKVSGRSGDVIRVPVQAPPGLPGRLLLVGVGEGEPADLRRAGAAVARAARSRQRLVTTLGSRSSGGSRGSGGSGGSASAERALIEGLLLGGYSPPASGLRSRAGNAPVAEIALVGRHDPAAIAIGITHAVATLQARDLAVTPSNVKTPAWLVEQAHELAAENGLEIEVWEEDRLRAEGFGGLLAVGAGSVNPPRFVRLDYPGRSGLPGSVGRARRPVVLVGKGITFDTGGLSIKPREGMVTMKTDMAGSAAVLATLAACRAARVRRPVIGLLALAENAVGAQSYRPSDVVRVYDGQTVEVTNTDAEGRIVLADALGYAVARLDPEVIVDIATLTGAASLGLGRRHAALYTAGEVKAAQRLSEGLLTAARASGEPLWQLPLVADYRPALDSEIADLRQITADPRISGGSIMAALFLREFTGGRPWAHLDIAGPARAEKDEHEVVKGATGYGARLMLRWLEGLR